MDKLIQQLTMLEYTADVDYMPPAGAARHILERNKYGIQSAEDCIVELREHLGLVNELIAEGKESFSSRETKRLIEESISTLEAL